ncbi:MAG: 3-hydroxyacyl-ACP dehydratase FabZ family protein [Christensenellales bacterium]|jgi:3-hydroxyacyl-[acyl-carrier-protein] dehydratase
MTRDEIMNILPHRADMLLIETAELSGDTAHATYTVRGDEFFLRGHFPDNPVVPGVILLEILAQSACTLFGGALEGGKTPLYTGIEKARFRRPVRPGDTIRAQSRLVRKKPPFYFCEGTLRVGDDICLSASFSFAIVG